MHMVEDDKNESDWEKNTCLSAKTGQRWGDATERNGKEEIKFIEHMITHTSFITNNLEDKVLGKEGWVDLGKSLWKKSTGGWDVEVI